MLCHHGITPYLVFDGGYLPSKLVTEVKRAAKRKESKKIGLELYQIGTKTQAMLELQKAVDVTPEMARLLIEELKKSGIKYVVAPYEADAQLAYLERKGIISGILSEDSDLLVFGVNCLLTKLDQYGDCIEINRRDFTACREISLVGWSNAEFRLMAILSGCDYLASIQKMGLKTAYGLVRRYKNIEKILQMLAFDSKYFIPSGYLDSFRKADLTFRHQRVFCPEINDLVYLTDPEFDAEPDNIPFVGEKLPKDIAVGIARGDLNPISKELIILQDTIRDTTCTPWQTRRTAPRRSSSTIDGLKENKSIETFFKTHRTPLAELDPNSLTPSPRQEALLEEDGRTSDLSSTPPSAIFPQSTMSAPASGLHSVLPTSNVKNPRHEETQSDLQLSKKRRLCRDVSIDKSLEESEGVTLARSRYFSSSLSVTNSSINVKRSAKRRVVNEINIWSDDSVEDVMVGLPDLPEYHNIKEQQNVTISKDQKKMVKSESSVVIQSDKVFPDNCESNTSPKVAIKPNKSVSTLRTDDSNSTKTVAEVMGKHLSNELANLSKKFLYTPSSSSEQDRFGHRVTRELSMVEEDTKTQLHRKRSMTPLERLGIGALNRSKSYATRLDIDPKMPTTTPTPNSHTTKNLEVVPLISSQGPEPIVTKGSEDLLRSDLEKDSDADNSTHETDEPEKSKLEVARFIFAG